MKKKIIPRLFLQSCYYLDTKIRESHNKKENCRLSDDAKILNKFITNKFKNR